MSMILPEEFAFRFAERTMANLRHIDNATKCQNPTTYEITQLVNSALGLLIFPKEKFFETIPQTQFTDLQGKGWPVREASNDVIDKIIREVGGGKLIAKRKKDKKKEVDDLRTMVKNMRHAFAHGNIAYYSSDGAKIEGLYIWNTPSGDDNKNIITWAAEFSVLELHQFCSKFCDAFLSLEPR